MENDEKRVVDWAELDGVLKEEEEKSEDEGRKQILLT
jgi:hypothetical protein